MKISKETIKHLKALAKLTHSSIPVTENFLIKDGKIIATDMEIIAEIKTDIKTNACVNQKEFIKTIELIPEFETESNEKYFVIKNGSEIAKLGNTTGDFPVWGKEEQKSIGSITKDDFENIEIAEKFTSNNELRPAMMKVFIDKDYICGTDAHKLYFSKSSCKLEESILLPKKVVKILSSFDIKEIKVLRNEKRITLETDILSISFLDQQERYPNFLAVIPEENPIKIKLSKKDLQETLKKALLFSNQATKKIVLNINGKVSISAEDIDLDKSYQKDLKAEKTAGEIEIGFNGQFLQDIANTIGGDDLELALSQANKAGIINGSYLLMPVMLNR